MMFALLFMLVASLDMLAMMDGWLNMLACWLRGLAGNAV
jgi:hypothetical protein